ncbi:Uncharacterised protein [Mycobacteroides abscessus]|nr:Uncharacterised protein [Mycobacteroides abscessus]
MWPSAVAKTMFWAGTSKSAAAACMSSASCARLNAKTASAVRPGSSAVHWRATAYSPSRVSSAGVSTAASVAGIASETIGPWSVERTSISMSSPPATRSVSVRVSSGTHSSPRRYVSSRTRSTKKSVTSAPMFVRPQASWALWPMTTPGKPANEKPATSNPHAGETSLQCSPTCAQMPGAPRARCGSFARIGLPDAVCSPETTHEFEPVPSPRPMSTGTAPSARSAASSAAWRWSEPYSARACGPRSSATSCGFSSSPGSRIGALSSDG